MALASFARSSFFSAMYVHMPLRGNSSVLKKISVAVEAQLCTPTTSLRSITFAPLHLYTVGVSGVSGASGE